MSSESPLRGLWGRLVGKNATYFAPGVCDAQKSATLWFAAAAFAARSWNGGALCLWSCPVWLPEKYALQRPYADDGGIVPPPGLPFADAGTTTDTATKPARITAANSRTEAPSPFIGWPHGGP